MLSTSASSIALIAGLHLLSFANATPILYDGRAPLNLSASVFNDLSGAYTYVVKGSKNATDYVKLDKRIPPTPLWEALFQPPKEQTISVSIDNSSVFVPGGNPANSQYGFRRTELIAEPHDRTIIETNTTVFHWSILRDDQHDLNYKHEYQVVFIEPNDGTHVFELQIGSPFTYPTGHLPVNDAQSLRILSHNLTTIFETPFTHGDWHNFAVQVDWNALTLGVYYSQNALPLAATSRKTFADTGAVAGANGQGDFHFGVLKLPIANPKDNSTFATDVVHHGIQEGSLETLHYSGVFVEGITGGVSVGYGLKVPAIHN